MRILGILGGIAAGKSHVARLLVARGAVLLDADAAGHAVLREPVVRDELVARWGEAILDPTGEINRRAVAAIVFGAHETTAAELAWLESITHPRIRTLLEARLDELRVADCPLAILDAPVMLKSGWNKLCDALLYVHADESVRLARAAERGWSAEQLRAREMAQEPLAVKRAHCQYEVDNSRDSAYTEKQIDQLWPRLIA